MEQKRDKQGRFDTMPHKVDPPKASDVNVPAAAPQPEVSVSTEAFDMIAAACNAYEARYERLGLPAPAASKILTTKECPVCEKKGMIVVDEAELAAYREGAFVQDAFKTLDADEREQILTGTHGPCFDSIFSYLDDEEDELEPEPEPVVHYLGEPDVPATAEKIYKVKGLYGKYTPVNTVLSETDFASYMENPAFTLESAEEYTPVIRYETDPSCARCRTDEYVPHYNCHYKGQAMGHSAAHCTADGCY